MRHAIFVGKITHKASRLLKRSGSTWPGHVSLKTDPSIVKKIILKNPNLKIILVAGTNGKTTTTKAIAHALESRGISTLTNRAGANLLNGLASILVGTVSYSGKLKHKVLIFETDENSLPKVLAEIPNPDGIVLLNLFRDQLDRYGEVNTTAQRWEKALEKLTNSSTVFANGDDPLITHVATAAPTHKYFSVTAKNKTSRSLSHAVDSTTCPKCNSPLDYLSISYSHLGNYFCPNCSFQNPKSSALDIQSTLSGTYNQYNLNAAAIVLKSIFEFKEKDLIDVFEKLKPAFGRQEEQLISGRKVLYLLSKNPTGFNESLKVALEKKSQSLFIILNDRIPDGRDISWIWDVDFEILKRTKLKVYVSGDRCYDMANRLLFAGVTHEVFDNFEDAFNKALKDTQDNETLSILPTYSAMLEVRKLISGRSIL